MAHLLADARARSGDEFKHDTHGVGSGYGNAVIARDLRSNAATRQRVGCGLE